MRSSRKRSQYQRAFPLALSMVFLGIPMLLQCHPVTALAAKRRELANSNNRHAVDRRTTFGLLLAPMVVLPTIAHAGIDVSSLKVEANPLDVFLGGTYYEDSSDDRDGVDGRLARRKYTIVEKQQQASKKQDDFFETLESRPVRILSESTAISSSRDDALELTGNLFVCKEHGGCISIDFSPLGGKLTRGYWDASESSIRFDDSTRVWSKQ